MRRGPWEEALAEALAHRGPRHLDPRPGELPAAVLVPLVDHDGVLSLLLEKRPESLPNHGGQLGFPGGVIEPGDGGPEQAALRETREEVGIAPSAVRILGRLDDLRTPTGYVITPVVGSVRGPVEVRPSPDEVAGILWIPVPRLLRGDAFRLVPRRAAGLLIRSSALVHEGEVVWGATARILLALRRVLRGVPGPWREGGCGREGPGSPGRKR